MRKHVLLPLMGCRTQEYLGMLLHYGVDPIYWPRAVVNTFLTLLGTPFRWYESLALPGNVRNIEIVAPVFILGFWRSGTTYLHNLMTTDPRCAYIDQFQTLFPHSAVTNRVARAFIGPVIPKKRPMDEVRLSLASPQEDDMALAIVDRSYYTGWYFSRQEVQMLNTYLTLQGLTRSDLQRWQNRYRLQLQKAMFLRKGAYLVSKNPAHTARIPALLEMFPDARFVHICRDPYEVYQSTLRLYDRARPHFAHHRKPADFAATVLETYKRVIGTYLSTRSLVSPGNLIEISYENLMKDPAAATSDIYRYFGIERSAEAERACNAFIESQRRYVPRQYQRDARISQVLKRDWKFAYEAFGYD